MYCVHQLINERVIFITVENFLLKQNLVQELSTFFNYGGCNFYFHLVRCTCVLDEIPQL